MRYTQSDVVLTVLLTLVVWKKCKGEKQWDARGISHI